MPPWAAALGGLALCCGLAAGAVRLSRRRKLRDRLLGAAVVCAVLTVFRLNYNYLASSSPLLLRTENPPPKVFVLSGQSNMAGRGGLVRKNGQARKVFDSSALEHEFERDLVRSSAHHDAKVERLTADMQWVPAVEPMHVDIDTAKSCGIGPGLMFARLVGDSSSNTRLIPCAVGGTRIDEWHATSPLYLAMLRRARFANAPIDALVWFQGESDALLASDALAYEDKLVEFIARVRRDLSPTVILVVNIWCALDRCPFRDEVRRAIASLSDKGGVVHVVDAKYDGADGGLQDDNIHLTSHAQRALAGRLSRAYQSAIQ